MRYRRALELFFLKAKEEFDKRKTKGEGVGLIIYHGCDFTEGEVRLRGTHVVSGAMLLPEIYKWKEGPAVFEEIMKDIVE